MNKFRTDLHIFKALLQSSRRNQIHMSWFLLLWIVVKCSLPFPMIIFPAKIIDSLIAGVPFERVLLLVFFMVGLNLVLVWMEKSLHAVCDIQLEKLKQCLHEELSLAVMEKKYEQIENNEFIKKVERAKVAVNGDLSWSVLRGLTGPKGVNAICYGFSDIVVNLIQILCYFYILSVLNIGIIFLIILVVAVNSVLSTKKKRIDFSQRNRTSEMSARMNICHKTMDDLKNAKDIRLFGMKNFLIGKYRENRENFFKIRQGFFGAYFGIEEGGLFVNGVQKAVVYGYLAFGVMKEKFTIGSFSRYYATITNFSRSLVTIIDSVININMFAEYMKDYYEIVGRLPDEDVQDNSVQSIGTMNRIDFEGVWFQYPGTKDYALKNVNLSIGAEEKLLIVGLNGAGKSTLVKLLLGLYKPTKGRILWNGTDISKFSGEKYTGLFSAAFQDYKIYAETLRENLLFDGKELGRMHEIVHKLQIDQIMEKNQIGYDDMLSKEFDRNGKELSQGQKQKIALARAICKDSQVVILDEPTAALDAYAEYELYKNFDDIVGEKTVLYISHRLSASVLCGRILVMKNGEITEDGSHEKLMADRKDYYEMYEKQAKNYC